MVGDSAINVADIDAFRSAAGLPQNEPLVMVVPSTGTPAENGDEVEADLDIEWSGAVAKGANVIYVLVGPNAPGGASDALTYAIDNNLAPVISNSFGLCESDATTSGALSTQQSVQQANAQGETVTSAAGDAGVADCDGDLATTPATASLGLAVDVPASIPEVTGVGGTEFTGMPRSPQPTGVRLKTFRIGIRHAAQPAALRRWNTFRKWCGTILRPQSRWAPGWPRAVAEPVRYLPSQLGRPALECLPMGTGMCRMYR